MADGIAVAQSERRTLPFAWAIGLIKLAANFTAVSYGLQVGISCAERMTSGEPLTPDLFRIDPIDWQDLKASAAVAGIILFELALVGWHQSSLRRLLCAPSDSAKTDWAFLLLMASGLYGALIALSGLGLLGYFNRHVAGWDGLIRLSHLPLWASLPALYVLRSFFSYWLHRAQHLRWLWGLHKTHHAAREFTSLNYLRAHPIELAMQTFANSVFYAALGFAGDAIIIFGLLVNAQQFLNHCNAAALAPLEKLGFVTPAGHRIHHGLDATHHNRNFGELLNIWDRLFGTYSPPSKETMSVPIGVEEGGVSYNSDALLRDFWAQTIEWWRHLGSGGR